MTLIEGSTFAQPPPHDARRERYEFGAFLLDVSNQRLLRAGEPVAITPKTLDLLLLLIRRRDRVVSKGELMRELWPDTIVEEANLTQQVFNLRKVLDEGADGQPSCIERSRDAATALRPTSVTCRRGNRPRAGAAPVESSWRSGSWWPSPPHWWW